MSCQSPVIVSDCSGIGNPNSCLQVMNETTEDILVTQVVPSGNPQYCFTITQGASANYTVPLNSGWKAVGVKSSDVYLQDFIVVNNPIMMKLTPYIPPPTPVKCSMKPVPWMKIFTIIGVASVILIVMLQSAVPKFNLESAVASGTSFTGAESRYNSAKGRLSLGIFLVLIVAAVTGGLWCFSDGPCSKLASCEQCNARGGLWSYTKPTTGGFWTKLLCNLLGKCQCTSEVLARQCAALGPDYEWNAQQGMQYMPPTAKNQTPYNCLCCNSSQCVDCTYSPCIPCNTK